MSCHHVSSISSYSSVMPRHPSLSPQARLNINTGIPIAYPRMVFLETALSSKFNPLVTLGRQGSILKGFVNKFNGDAELLDDLVFIPFFPRLHSELIILCRMTTGRPNTTRSLSRIRGRPSAHCTLLGGAQSVHPKTSAICSGTTNSHFILDWRRSLCGGWCAQDLEQGQGIHGSCSGFRLPVHDQCRV